jgi:hypothetical protein
MSDLHATTLDGSRTVIERKNVETFAARSSSPGARL